MATNKALVKQAKEILKKSKDLPLTEEVKAWHSWMSHPKGDSCTGCKTPPIPERVAIYSQLARNP